MEQQLQLFLMNVVVVLVIRVRIRRLQGYISVVGSFLMKSTSLLHLLLLSQTILYPRLCFLCPSISLYPSVHRLSTSRPLSDGRNVLTNTTEQRRISILHITWHPSFIIDDIDSVLTIDPPLPLYDAHCVQYVWSQPCWVEIDKDFNWSTNILILTDKLRLWHPTSASPLGSWSIMSEIPAELDTNVEWILWSVHFFSFVQAFLPIEIKDIFQRIHMLCVCLMNEGFLCL